MIKQRLFTATAGRVASAKELRETRLTFFIFYWSRAHFEQIFIEYIVDLESACMSFRAAVAVGAWAEKMVPGLGSGVATHPGVGPCLRQVKFVK